MVASAPAQSLTREHSSSSLLSRKSSSNMNISWQFDDPRYVRKSRQLKRSAYSSKVLAWIIHPEPRYLMAVCLFLATLTAYVERTGFSIAYTLMASESGGVSESTKGAVMSAFYWGYGISQVPGGIAAQRYGGDRVLTLCFVSWSLASLMTPGDARNTLQLIFWRFVVGVSQGFLIPAVHTVVSVWMKKEERAKAVSLITSGMYLGSASAMWFLPFVSQLFGGKAILRLVGLAGLCWVVLFRLVAGGERGGAEIGKGNLGDSEEDGLPVVRGDSSSSSMMASAGQTAGQTAGQNSGQNSGQTAGQLGLLGSSGLAKKKQFVHFLGNRSVQAIVVNNFTFHYAFYIVMNWLPTYFDKVLHKPIQSVGFAKTLPYLAMFLTSNAGAWVGDFMIRQRGASVAAGRKLVNTCGFVVAAGMLCLMPSASDVTSGLVCTTLALGAAGFARGGFSVNHMDIAPAHAGVIMGISNTAGTLSGVIGVAVTGYILSAWGVEDKRGWYASLVLAAGLCLAGALVFIRNAQGRKLFS
jgi:ACS family sodium-dependent inorganic phosphate cotransporter